MLIACKCLNFIASSNQTIQRKDGSDKSEQVSADGTETDVTISPQNSATVNVNLDELRRLPQTSRIHDECLQFFTQATGPLSELSEHFVQTELIFKVPIEPWSLHYCINCNTITHATNTSNSTYLINSKLLTNNEEINSLKAGKSYSKIFGILLPNSSQQRFWEGTASAVTSLTDNSGNGSNTINLSAASTSNNISYKVKQQLQQPRIKKLTQQLNNQLQREIYETDERIRRYTEQQFALLKSYREKAEQEYQIIVSLVNQVPEQLKVIEAINNLTTNQSSSPATTPTTSTIATTPIEGGHTNTNIGGGGLGMTGITVDNNSQSLFALKHQQNVSSLDTPPATPDSTPMSIGNSPTFRQQTSIFGSSTGRSPMLGSHSGNNATTLDGDCLFELEGMETYPVSTSNAMSDVEETEDAEDALSELDSGIHIPRSQRRQSLNIAKSLPISIAAKTEAPPTNKFDMVDIDDDELPDDSNVDIAASIKAIAKSLHGDTVFGDLPRPRFSTHI